jgi:hypothetical protein
MLTPFFLGLHTAKVLGLFGGDAICNPLQEAEYE